MSLLARILALLLAVMVVILIPIAVWVNSSYDLLTPETFKEGLVDQNIYPDIVPVVLPAILASGSNPNNLVSRVGESVGDEQWRAIATELVPPEWVQAQIESGLHNYFAWLEGDVTAIDRRLDTQLVLERLTGDEATRAVNLMMVASDACTEDEIAILRAYQAGQSDDLVPVCQPPEDLVQLERTLLRDQLRNIALSIGQQDVSLVGLFGGDVARNALLAQRLTYQSAPEFMTIFYMIPLSIAALVVVLVVRSLKNLGRWLGWMSIASGLVALIPLAILPLAIIGSLEGDVVVSDSALDAETRLFLVRLATGLLTSIFTSFSEPVLGQAFFLVVVGLVMLAVAAFVPDTPQFVSINDSSTATSTGMNVAHHDERTIIEDSGTKKRRKIPRIPGNRKSKSTAERNDDESENVPDNDSPTLT